MVKNKHITDRLSNKLDDAAAPLTKNSEPGLIGLSPNPATNMFIADIALRGISRLARNTLHKSVLQNKYGPNKAKRIVENKSLFHTLALYGASRVATRSVPGAMVVTTGLLAKALYDRSKSKHGAKRDGEKTLNKMAKE